MQQELQFPKEVVFEKKAVNSIFQPHTSTSVTNAYKTGIVPFIRATEVLRLMEQDIDNFKEEERPQLKQTLQELERSLAQIRAKL